MIVTDASAAIAALINDGQARRTLSGEQLHVPHLIDSEVASALHRQVRADHLTAANGWDTPGTWSQLAATRYATHGLLPRIWALRDKLSAYNAGYVALAEALGCTLVTADARLAHAPSINCTVTVVPS